MHFSPETVNSKPDDVWKPKTMRALRSGIPHERQWDEIKHLRFVRV